MGAVTRIQQILYVYQTKFITIKNHYYPHQELNHTIDLYLYKNSLETKFDEINAEIQTLEKLGKMNSSDHHDSINERKTLLIKQKKILEEIEERELAKKEADKKIEKAQKELIGELKTLLTQELSTIRRNINTSKPNDSNQYEEFLKDLTEAQTLCENTLRKIEDAEKEQHSDDFIIADDLNGTVHNYSTTKRVSSNPQIIDDMEEHSTNPYFLETRKQPETLHEEEQPEKSKEEEQPEKSKKEGQPVKTPYFIIYDDLNGTKEYVYYSRRKSSILLKMKKKLMILKRQKNKNFKVIDDMEIAHQEYKDMHCDKKIYAYISYILQKNQKNQKNQIENKKFAIPISSINEDKKTIYKRTGIDKICEEVAGGGIIGRLNRLYLSRKLNPNTIKILDRIGNYKMIRDYIESLYFNTNFLFDLSYDLRDLNAIQKWKFQKFTKSEEKSGVKIIGKLFNKNSSLLESPKSANLDDETDFSKRIKANGNNEKVAKDFNKNNPSHQKQQESSTFDLNSDDSHDSH